MSGARRNRAAKLSPLSPTGQSALACSNDLGYLVIPLYGINADGSCSCGDPGCENPGKHPTSRNGLHDGATHPDAVAAWFDAAPNANVGIVTGKRSGIVVIDVDGPEAEAALAAIAEIPETIEVRTARGRHIYLKHPGGPVTIPNSQAKLAPKLDVRGDGGYVVGPASTHVSGATYQWIRDPFMMECAEIPPRLLTLITAPDEKRLPITREIPGATTATVIADAKARGISSTDIAAMLNRRIIRYLETVGHCTQGSRNGTAFRVARWLVSDFGLSEQTAWAYLAEWNTGNHPPLTERELHQVMRSAKRNGRRQVGCAHRRSVR